MSATTKRYDLDASGSHVILTLKQELNDVQWAQIEQVGTEVLQDLQDRRSPSCLIDLSPMHYMGSAMVALIVRIWKAVNDKGGRVVVVVGDDMVLKVISLAGLDKVWNIARTREDGLKQLGGRVTRNSSGQATVSARPSAIVVVISVIGMLVAGAGLGVLYGNYATEPIGQGLVFGGAVVGVLAGLISLVRDQGGRRLLAAVSTVACVGLAVAGWMNFPV
ncbi:STAS domain protein [Maioricimonas rarisocia]|uniref:STAS domain protein n=1 Tax=Maioricimonas rarisocia TaxID=2528026 RepID=A0A517Z2S1_9PLAN|nr:STAS domain-containing protein [Maioricimonas rarisocia]QDU36765.1 STAS domain protein [Maioricimonas rarisocia]